MECAGLSARKAFLIFFLAACLGLLALMAYDVATAFAGRKPTVKHRKLWLCIHRQEGSWHDPHPPYWGGLQMGMWFMRTYAPWHLRRYGTADRWPPAMQVRVAERAFRREGYSVRWLLGQWPNTAPACIHHV